MSSADLGGDHGFPGFVLRGDPAQHVAAEDRQVLGPVVVQVDEAAPVVEVVVQRLELGLDLDVVDRLELVVGRRLVGVDVELQAVLEQPAEAFQDPAGQLRVVLLVEQVDEARHAHHDADPLGGPFPDVGGQPVVVEVVGDQDRLAARGEQLGPGQEVPPVDVLSPGQQVPHRDLGELQDRLAGHGRVLRELFLGRLRACPGSRAWAAGSCPARPGPPSCAAPRSAAAPRGRGRTSRRRSARSGRA